MSDQDTSDKFLRLASDHLAQNIPDGEIEQSLVEAGCDRYLASRIVSTLRNTRARGLRLGGRALVIRGGFWLCGGLAVTVATYFMAGPGQTYVLAFGPILYGVVLMVQGARYARSGVGYDLRRSFAEGQMADHPVQVLAGATRDPVARADIERDPGAAAFCPRCGAQFVPQVVSCSECQVPLRPFPTERT